MRNIVYYIASSLDGFIARENGSVEGFLMEGSHADDFLSKLQHYDTVLMGRKTYEFGFQFGLTPGQPAYPGLKHYIYSKSLSFKSGSEVTLIQSDTVESVKALKNRTGKDIWLCGGGTLAGVLLNHDLIDRVLIKVNPLILGKGIGLFDSNMNRNNTIPRRKPVFIDSRAYDNGVVLWQYEFSRL